ncbi:TPX2 (targeting protein for Xklp2) protein family [Forsythia ovata]|uniref:TPX2 (Targeting protein for Xklp2) protein family n=1 Tax=Forsythia ovata TaxID=205694 RepID=A0ABD1UDU3_9LAMI
MDSCSKTAGAITPAKESNRSKFSEISKQLENFNPNVSSPGFKSSNSPCIKSAKSARSQKSTSRKPNPTGSSQVASPSPVKKIRQRKFLIAKKKSGKEELNSSGAASVECNKCKKATGKSKCLCVAYESLRASQEEFFKNRSKIDDKVGLEKLCDDDTANGGSEVNPISQNPEIAEGFGGGKVEENADLCEITRVNKDDVGNVDVNGETGIKRRRGRQLKEGRECVPGPGSGKVMHLVKAFEKLLSIPKSSDSEEKEVDEEEDTNTEMKKPIEVPATQVSSSSFCPSDVFLTFESLGLDSVSHRSSSLDSSQGSFSISSKTSASGRRSRRKSFESSGTFVRRHGKRQLQATSQKPFMLRTEQRGRCKEEEFMKKVQEIMEEEEKLRIPVAQGLPWTTDQPECLVRPSIKDNTRPVDLVLHSDIRAVERAEFDHQVADKMSFIEQYKMERERQRKLAEEEEIKRLRKDLVPKAQPMPYFDRPFIPRRLMKHPANKSMEPKANASQQEKIKC